MIGTPRRPLLRALRLPGDIMALLFTHNEAWRFVLDAAIQFVRRSPDQADTVVEAR